MGWVLAEKVRKEWIYQANRKTELRGYFFSLNSLQVWKLVLSFQLVMSSITTLRSERAKVVWLAKTFIPKYKKCFLSHDMDTFKSQWPVRRYWPYPSSVGK